MQHLNSAGYTNIWGTMLSFDIHRKSPILCDGSWISSASAFQIVGSAARSSDVDWLSVNVDEWRRRRPERNSRASLFVPGSVYGDCELIWVNFDRSIFSQKTELKSWLSAHKDWTFGDSRCFIYMKVDCRARDCCALTTSSPWNLWLTPWFDFLYSNQNRAKADRHQNQCSSYNLNEKSTESKLSSTIVYLTFIIRVDAQCDSFSALTRWNRPEVNRIALCSLLMKFHGSCCIWWRFYICVLLQIVRRYDILLIQEIRDRFQTAIDTLVNAVNTQIG